MSTSNLPQTPTQTEEEKENAITLDQFKEALPASLKRSVTTDVVNKVTSLLSNPDLRESYRDNLISYTSVLSEGRFKLVNYIDAVKYVSFKLMSMTNIRAFELTFPHKIQDWTTRGISDKEISSYVSAYNRSKLVNLIFEQTLVPTHVLNQDLYQKALNVQADLMVSSASDFVRTQAANSLLTQLKPPETKRFELNVSHKEGSEIDELRKATMELAKAQREAIQGGQMTAQEIAHTQILEAEYEEVS